MSDKIKLPVVLALGYFDSVHKGHQKVINTAREIADKKNANLVVVTFGGNLKALILGDREKVVYTATEREKLDCLCILLSYIRKTPFLPLF